MNAVQSRGLGRLVAGILGLVVSLVRCASRLRIAIARSEKSPGRMAPWLAGGALAVVFVSVTAIRSGPNSQAANESFGYGDLVSITWETDIPGINASLHGVGSISGIVTDEDTAGPLEGMCASASGLTYRTATTDSSGHYTIDNLDAGDYTLWFRDCANQPPLYIAECHDNKPDWQDCDPVHVGDGASVVGIDAALAKGGAITGTITNEQTGFFLYPVTVEVYDLSGEIRQSGFNDSIAGLYAIGPLPVGEYRVRFSLNYPGVPPHEAEWYSEKDDFDSADLVAIGPGTVAVIDASLTGITHGDVDCSGAITSVDALQFLRFVAGLYAPYQRGCPSIGSSIWTSLWGDIDCSDTVDTVDALQILRFISGLAVAQSGSCRLIGEYWGTPPS